MTITLTSKIDGFGLNALSVEPSSAPIGGVVVIQEIFGLSEHIGEMCGFFADAGYRAQAIAKSIIVIRAKARTLSPPPLRKKNGGWMAFAILVNGSQKTKHVPLYKAMEAIRNDVGAVLAKN